MNIKDLKPSEYKVIDQPININSLPQGSYKNVSDIIQEDNIQKDKQKSLMEKLKERAGNIANIVQKPQDMASILTGEKNIQAAGQIAGGINDIIGAGLGWAGGKIAEATPKAVKEPIKSAGVAILQSPAGQAGLNAIKGGMESYNSWKQSNPRIAQDLEAVVNIATLLPIVKAGQSVKKTVLETNVAKNYIKQQAEKTAVKTAKDFDNLVGTITQGKVKDIPIAQKALSNIDIEGIKTYKDAVNAVNNKISSIATKLDDALLTDKTLRSFETLKYKNHNFINDAIKQLDDFYTKVNDIDKKTVINNIATKAKTEGLTVKEINDIARLHGQDLNAFNASGELASGLTKQAAENTRTGVKNTAKTLFNNPVFDAADKEMSNLIKVKDLFNKQVEAVNKLQQKIMERSLGEKVGRMAAKVFNTLGGNAPKGAVEYFLGRGTGLKTINALEMEKMLQKNLQKLQKIANDKLSDKQLIKELEKIVNDLPSTPPILPPTIKSKTSPLNLNKEIKPTTNLPQNTSKWNQLAVQTPANNAIPINTNAIKTPILSKVNQIKPTTTLPQNTSKVNTLSTSTQKYIPPEDLIKKTVKYEGGYKTIIEQKSTGKEIANIGSSPAYGKELLKNGYSYTGGTDALFTTSMSKTSGTGMSKLSGSQAIKKSDPTTVIYHGTSLENANRIKAEGFKVGAGKGISGQTSDDFIYASSNKTSANKYISDRLSIKNPTVIKGGFNGKTLEIQGKMADFEAFGEASKKLGVPLEIGSQGKPTMLNMPAIKKAMQDQGYGAISFSDMYANGSKAYAILPENIKTKSQLTDIWKKANKLIK